MSALDEALDAIRRRDAARAEECARRAVGEAPGEARARAALALALVLARRGREALAEADWAVAARARACDRSDACGSIELTSRTATSSPSVSKIGTAEQLRSICRVRKC